MSARRSGVREMSCRGDYYACIPSRFYDFFILRVRLTGVIPFTKAQEDGGVVDPFLGICTGKSLF